VDRWIRQHRGGPGGRLRRDLGEGLGWPTDGIVGQEFHDQVDELLRQVEAAGGTLTAPPHLRPFGVYSGYFSDPDGHLFEIAWDSNG
jgi:catechol 2,3-dioxygenase-like lactoylglutathione lyase family enzyme